MAVEKVVSCAFTGVLLHSESARAATVRPTGDSPLINRNRLPGYICTVGTVCLQRKKEPLMKISV